MPEDTDAALEWMDFQRTLCSGCGLPLRETFDEDGPEYVAEAWCCFACKAREEKALEWGQDAPEDRAGIKFIVQERGEEP